MIYGYCRISTPKQSLERQVRNIRAAYPEAHISQEIYTGTKINRKEFDKILNVVREGDTIVFDSVSRMSRNAEEGFALYQELFDRKIDLVFLKEPHINTSVYRETISKQIDMTGQDVDVILEGVNRYLMILARKQVEIAFDQAQKEVDDNHQRTREGIQTARLNGKQIGQRKGIKLNVKKANQAKEIIRKHNHDFGGTLSDEETLRLCQCSRNSFYKYKKELKSTNSGII